MRRGKLTDRPCLVFLLGAALLFAQYDYIRRVAEFYPSISLPAGDVLVRDDRDSAVYRRLVFAVTADGLRVQVEANDLLAEFPIQYRSPIVERGFGLLPGASTTGEDAEEAREWLRSRVRSLLTRDDVTALEIVLTRSAPGAAVGPTPHPALRVVRIEL